MSVQSPLILFWLHSNSRFSLLAMFVLILVALTTANAVGTKPTSRGAGTSGSGKGDEKTVIQGEKVTVTYADDEIFIETEGELNIEEIATFWQAVYRKEVRPKISNGTPLSGRDTCILKGHLDSLVAVNQAYATALAIDFLGETTAEGKELFGDAEGKSDRHIPTSDGTDTPSTSKETELESAHLNAVRLFAESKTPATRKTIKAFGEKYQVIPKDDREEELAFLLYQTYEGMRNKPIRLRFPEFDELMENMGKDIKERFGEHFVEHLVKALLMPPSFPPPYQDVLEIPRKLIKQQKRLNKEALAPYRNLNLHDNSRKLARLWTAANKKRDPWSNEIGRSIEELEDYWRAPTKSHLVR